MRRFLVFALLISAAAAAEVTHGIADTTTTAKSEKRHTRQLSSGGVAVGIPIFFDNTIAQEPIAMVTPVLSKPPSDQQPAFLPGFAQNIPIVGPILTNLPLQNLLGGIGGLNLGNLGQLGGLGNLGSLNPLGSLINLGVPKPPVTPITTPPQSCPITQRLTCRCEPLLPLPVRDSDFLHEIAKQNIRRNGDGSREMYLVISNGIVIYHRLNKNATKQQGYYSVPFQKEIYLNIHYSINQSNYTVRADVGSSPPKTDFDRLSESN